MVDNPYKSYGNASELNQSTPHSQPNSRCLIIAVVMGLVMLGMSVCGGGIVALFYFGMGEIANEIKNQLNENPQILEHLGEITELKVNILTTAEFDDEDIFVYDAVGTKRSGELIVDSTSSFDAPEKINSVTIRFSDGERIEVDLLNDGTR